MFDDCNQAPGTRSEEKALQKCQFNNEFKSLRICKWKQKDYYIYVISGFGISPLGLAPPCFELLQWPSRPFAPADSF